MKRDSISNLVLLVMVLGISAVFLTMINSFLMPLLMAGIFSAMLKPTHRWLSEKLGGRQNLASILTIIGIVALVLVPLSVLVGIVAAQALSVSESVTPFVQSFIDSPSVATHYLSKLPFYEQILPYRDFIFQRIGHVVATVSSFLVNSLSSVTKLTVNAIFGSIIMLYVMFYFFTMGDVLLNKILYYLPLRDDEERRLLKQFTSVTRATIKGTLIIGIMQGTICGLCFFLAGIKGSVFWGTLMAVASVIPAFGTAIVWGPALIVLVLIGDFAGVSILAIGCGLIAGNLDNLVRPRLVGKDTEMHDLYVLFGTLGGISMFGILGIIIGPIIAALFMTVWDIYGDSFKDYLPKVGNALQNLVDEPAAERDETFAGSPDQDSDEHNG